MRAAEAPIERVQAKAYQVPTDAPESDGTFAWERTTLVVAEIAAAGRTGLGYTYAAGAVAGIIRSALAPVLLRDDAFAIPRLWEARASPQLRLAWDRGDGDLGARRGALGSEGAAARGAARAALWSGSRPSAGLRQRRVHQLFRGAPARAAWRLDPRAGVPVRKDEGRQPPGGRSHAHGGGKGGHRRRGPDDRRQRRVRSQQALLFAERAAELGAIWFEEPVSSDDLEGLQLLRDRAPAVMDVAAGEYGYDPFYFKRIMDAGAVDVLQADATRCCGYTGFLRAAALADAASLPLSAHTAPALHLPVCLAAPRLRHAEWFHDHVRIERMLFDGAPVVSDGVMRPDLGRPGHGLEFRRADAEPFALA